MRPILFLFLAVCLLSIACEKVIQIELNEADSRIVVEAPMFEGVNDFTVRITKSGNYFGSEPLKTVDDAVVTLTEENNTVTTLDNLGNGFYQINGFNAIADRNYQLDVLAEGETISATSFLPAIVAIDSLRTEFEPESAFGDAGYVLYTVYDDPANEENYYRLTYDASVTENEGGYFLFDDAFTDGNTIDIPNFTERYQLGEEVTVQLISMDKYVHDYYTTLDAIVDGGGSAAPANPNTNLVGNALGYFGGFSISTATIVVTE